MSASLDQYWEMMADRPRKFSAKDVEYEETASGDHQCHGCHHLYRSLTYPERIVCEIFRPSDDSNVRPEGWCKFWSKDGHDMPDVKEES